MQFYAPQLLWLILIPAALLLWELGRRARAAARAHPKILSAEARANTVRLTALAAREPTRARPIKRGGRPLLWIGLALGIVALARPQYGEREVSVFEQSREVLIALDLSRSMLAEDVKPSRLARAKLLITGLFERLAGERVGLIVFSGTAFLQSPLSSDYEILREFLPSLGPDTLPEGGTNYRALLDTALDAFSDSPATDRFLIILSDGEATDDTWAHTLDALKKRGIRTIALGIGSPAGAMIPDGGGGAGEAGGFVKDERGAVVLSRLEPATLRALATETRGLYRDASTWLDLAALITETVEQGAQGQFTDTRTQRLIDRYQWALAPALGLLLLSFLLEFPVRPRPRSLTLQPAKNAASLLLLAALILGNTAIDARAQSVGDLREQLAHDENAAAAPSSALGKIVTRLADSPTPPTGRNWAELARETITWGQKLQTEQHPVPPGPVHDALHAVTLGEALDPKTADWPQLRSELEALLQTQEQQDPEKPEDQSQQNPEQNKTGDSQNSQGGDQEQNQDGSQDGENRKSNSDNSESQNSGDPQTDDSEQSGQNDGQQSQGPQSESLGDMSEDAPKPEAENEARDRNEDAQQNGAATAPPHKGPTQQVGGAQAQSPTTEAKDPALAAALQKLEQIKGSDSPAQLFQLMDNTPRDESANASKKNW
ncbi:hypothetical protein AXK12_05465 [Cephaloticoccus capnophilus]|uniref:VWFA domain-containing protein n=1 Tax=Cephaloticoccus capnophilus TaxID=1548208 RepID=A0A139SL87_9BACT|nr:VWA domain-containing protein [Cephaloticoccus capnophilus]KXU35297.1 hypothetical protein AXK12_05465 [Cephaloticoccus capnophilus]